MPYAVPHFALIDMVQTLINHHFAALPDSYLFSQVAEQVAHYKALHPQAEVISLGIGDVTIPLAPAVCQAMHRAVDELGSAHTFRGYGPEHGQMFLRTAIAEHDYRARGIDIDEDEIFVSDGAKSDLGNINDLLSAANRVAITDPVYPVYVDTNVMAGRAGHLGQDGHWSDIVYLPCTHANGFVPELPEQRVSIIYLCYPNNPTGTTLSREQLSVWVDYARRQGAIILFDSAYEAYITTPGVPHSIYEIEGAKQVAIEVRSFSKTAGFTSLRCGYTVVPKELMASDETGQKYSLNKMWERRQSTKFNGASYISQRAAEAVYTPQGQAYARIAIQTYMQNAQTLLQACTEAGLTVYGGVDAPYVWVKTPQGIDSWGYFHTLLEEHQIVCTPGCGFGPCGEGYVRLTAFNTPELTRRAAQRIRGMKN